MRKKVIFIFLIILAIGFLFSSDVVMPVKDADKNSYNPNSFWYYPWGRSVTHKGVDIFAKHGTQVNSATSGLVLFTDEIRVGGNVVIVLGPKWRIHYYAHLDKVFISTFSWVSQNEKIGSVGDTGNAKGKQPHLHYSIGTLIPYPWNIDGSKQGWKKMFYINPIPLIENDLLETSN